MYVLVYSGVCKPTRKCPLTQGNMADRFVRLIYGAQYVQTNRPAWSGVRHRVYTRIVSRTKTMYLYFMGSDTQIYVQYVHTPHGASTCMQYTNVIQCTFGVFGCMTNPVSKCLFIGLCKIKRVTTSPEPAHVGTRCSFSRVRIRQTTGVCPFVLSGRYR